MSPDILIIRDGDAYRMLHGHLHLATQLSLCNEVFVDVQNEGKVKIVKTHTGFAVGEGSQRLPLLRN